MVRDVKLPSLISKPSCALPRSCKVLTLTKVDASGVGLGAVLAQGKEGEECPLLYLSRKLHPRETRYSAIEKESLAIKWALDSLRYYLLGRTFDFETDHWALSWINSMRDKNSRVTRWYLALQPYCFNITQSCKNELACRLPVPPS
jgi:hypothetical protein